MKKGLLILLIIPVFSYAQDTPLIEQKVTTEKMEKKERKLKEKNASFAMHPKNQIGYIMNPVSCPFGLNYYNFFKSRFGWYINYKNDFGVLAEEPSGYASGYDDGYSNFNIGLAPYLFGNQNYALIGYIGIGIAVNDDPYSLIDDGTYGNFNFGILRQTNSVISWQLGFDSAVPGINFGMGFTWN